MSKKYHLDQNEEAFVHCINSVFAGLYTYIEMLKETGKKITKKDMLKSMQEVIGSTNTALVSEYIRGELIKKGVFSNEDPIGLCTFDPSVENKNSETVVYTQDELDTIRTEKKLQPDWANSSESSPEPR